MLYVIGNFKLSSDISDFISVLGEGLGGGPPPNPHMRQLNVNEQLKTKAKGERGKVKVSGSLRIPCPFVTFLCLGSL